MFNSLAKLRISAHTDRKCDATSQAGSIEVMYNPASIDLSYESEYLPNQFLNADGLNYRFSRALPGTLNLELVFDATLPGNSKDVDAQLNDLRKLCHEVKPDTHETHFLRVSWGSMEINEGQTGKTYFVGRASRLAVSYNLFCSDGRPMRAVVQLALEGDPSITDDKRSDSMPQALTVGGVDMIDLDQLLFMSMLAALVGFTGLAVLEFALENALDSFDDVAPGDVLIGATPGT